MNVMNINTDAIDEVALALLYLTLHDQYAVEYALQSIASCLLRRSLSIHTRFTLCAKLFAPSTGYSA
jgi:hypothetical protein